MGAPTGVAPADLKSSKGYRVWSPVWTADSKAVLVRKMATGTETLQEQWMVYLDGRPAQKLEAPIANNTWLYGVHPDGKRMLYTVDASDLTRVSQVLVLENFLPVSK